MLKKTTYQINKNLEAVSFLFFVAIASISYTEAKAQVPLEKHGSCPPGYYTSAAYCIPTDSAKPTMLKQGSNCPSGTYSSGGYCVSSGGKPIDAVPKVGSVCPSGYFSDGAYCKKAH
jgi:hypothetical protein